jgi:hypothetical protein
VGTTACRPFVFALLWRPGSKPELASADFMKRHSIAALAGLVTASMTVAATAHHSIAVFDQAHPIELVGTVREFLFTSPHTFIRLEVRDKDSHEVVWNLEGNSPNSLAWGGWSHDSLRPGDQLRLTIYPLRSGAPGGAWNPALARFRDGSPIVAGH